MKKKKKKKKHIFALTIHVRILTLSRSPILFAVRIDMPPPPHDDVDGADVPKEPAAAGPPTKKVERAAPISQLEEANLEPTGDAGLSHEEAASRLARFGRNELAEHKTSKWLVFLKLVSVLETGARVSRDRCNAFDDMMLMGWGFIFLFFFFAVDLFSASTVKVDGVRKLLRPFLVLKKKKKKKKKLLR